MAISRKAVKLLFLMWVVVGGIGLVEFSHAVDTVIKESQKAEAKSFISKALHRMDAPIMAEKTLPFFDADSKRRLNQLAELVMSKLLFEKDKKLIHISNPDLHRMLCFFVTRYVYSIEEQRLPHETQVYKLNGGSAIAHSQLNAEIKDLQALFNQCHKLGVKMKPNGVVYFSWDQLAYLNSIILELRRAEFLLASPDVPEMYRDDVFLASLFLTAAVSARHEGRKDKFLEQLSDETVSLMMEGVKSGIGEGVVEDLDFKRIAQYAFKKAGKNLLQKLGKRLWKRRHLVRTLVEDDADLLEEKKEEDVAALLTNLVATPSPAMVSRKSFVNSLKNILSNDAKFKLKVGSDKIYAGFTVKFE